MPRSNEEAYTVYKVGIFSPVSCMSGHRFLLEKHASELLHLELSLMMEEISAFFYESSKTKEDEYHKGNGVRLVPYQLRALS